MKEVLVVIIQPPVIPQTWVLPREDSMEGFRGRMIQKEQCRGNPPWLPIRGAGTGACPYIFYQIYNEVSRRGEPMCSPFNRGVRMMFPPFKGNSRGNHAS